MRRIALSGAHARTRARRWDALVLGSGLTGWVAAVRLAMSHLRVLVVEERDAARRPASLRTPFFLPATGTGGVLDACLHECALPLIERHRLAPQQPSYQVVLPNARVAVGAPAFTADELVAWGLAKPDDARAVMRGLAEAAAAERAALVAAPVVHLGGLRERALAFGRGAATRHARGLPEEVAHPPAELVPFFDAQVRALACVAHPRPTPEARARLLGAPLAGAAALDTPERSLEGMLRRRFAELHGEVRAIAGRFELVSVDDAAGIAPRDAGEIWLGRALVLNAPRSALAAWLRESGSEIPRGLEGGPVARRVALRLAARPSVLPEGMGMRLVRVNDPTRPLEGTNLITVGVFPRRQGFVEIVASAILDGAQPDEDAAAPELEDAVRSLVPFAGGRLERLDPPPRPGWDDEALLEDPRSAGGWPGTSDLRLASRPRLYRLPREEWGILGVEGECLLGWRAGDAIRAELGT